jgi:hypothetical protein
MKRILAPLLLVVLLFGYSYGEEIPRPTYDNSLIFSITHYFLNEDMVEIEYIKSRFGNGMYAPLYFSGFVGVEMDWNIDINNAGNGIQAFKDELDAMIAFAKQHNVGIHLTVNYGIARLVNFYKDAKEEDVRNAQWYNDNNISSAAQAGGASITNSRDTAFPIDLNHVDGSAGSLKQPWADSSVINKYVFTTLSRYARKLKGHLDAKVEAVFAYLKQQQNANPDVIIIISAPGEAELNYHRINNNQYMQDYFCDYSPFAVLEFRDWIKHEGLYGGGEKYAGQGYANGGSRYQGAGGLAKFNADFGTSFSSWDLKYYNWDLSDAVDSNYSDTANPAPNIIPVSQYTHNGMKPVSGADYISGGFDPPRVMVEPGSDDFYDLWHTFRENMVHNYVKDMAEIARGSGFPKNQYFTHQIPGDYLFGTRPNDPSIPLLNPRYYSSAAPMWTADAYSDIGLGVTLYDINFGTWTARTTLYGIGAANAMSDNWAALEYNPEVIPSGYSVALSSTQTLYSEMIRMYNGNPHIISFFKWKGQEAYQFKDTNRETALKQFFDAVKDKARQGISTVLTPKEVENFSANFSETTGLVDLSWSGKIWTDLTYNWTDWGDFKEFVIYRGYTENFTANSSSEIVRQTNPGYLDYGFQTSTTVYYKIAAVNSSGQTGPMQSASVEVTDVVFNPILSVSRDRLNFTYLIEGDAPPAQVYRISNAGTGPLNWSTTRDAAWLTCDPASGINGASVNVTVDPTGLPAGTYTAVITVSDPAAADSPQTLTAYLTVKNASQNQQPFGEFSTPTDNSTVSSSIAVTGWVLDDVGVESVKIYRDPVQGEGPQMVYIGTALFVEGARPDLEVAYPDYPANYQAGWGYMLLTNFLPSGGNGTFTLYAIAGDTSGSEVTLGTKTITCDNANAVKPFGAIDTPAQGGTASGSSFRNHGWALTPMPNLIPFDGSTINVYIDGVNKGSVVYNVSRSDIAGLFPGYANSSGAGGYFDIDTNRYADGIHSIAWIAEDSAGNSDGIGSRFFAIQNTGSARSMAQGAGSVERGVWPVHELSKMPLDTSASVKVRKGYRTDVKPGTVSPDTRGIINLEIKELSRVEVHLNRNCRGFLVKGKQFKPLPAGSTMDSERGIFYWQPVAGYVGDYTFDFVGFDFAAGKMKRKRVKIKILPKH